MRVTLLEAFIAFYGQVCSALASVCRLVNLEMIPAISPLVFKLLSHPQEAVRKKAVVAVHKFFKIVPETVLDHKDQIRKVLCDPDPSVMGASLHVLCEALSHLLIFHHMSHITYIHICIYICYIISFIDYI